MGILTKRESLLSSLSQIKNNAIASIDTETKVALMGGKKNPMLNRVTKKSSGGAIMLFGNSKSNGYANMKNRLQEKQAIDNNEEMPAKFVPKPRPWGNRISNTPLVFHKDKVYAEVVWLKAPSKVEYFLDGRPIAKSEIEGMKVSKPKSSKKRIELRTVNIDNITSFKCGALSVR